MSFAPGAESLIRNLLLGMEWSRSFGGSEQDPPHAGHLWHHAEYAGDLRRIRHRYLLFMRGHPGEVPGLVSCIALEQSNFPIPASTRMFRWRTPDGESSPRVSLA